ncbi:hypothetical protein BC828DRAFT_375993 [Blastocladiella britannica]|nr:hypothetical protein BC828DRAFT_375993 [Blastocladiella britannica]
MSINLQWHLLDSTLAEAFERFLVSRIEPIAAASGHLRNLRIANLDWGPTPPEITVLDLVAPFDDLYAQPSACPPPPPPHSQPVSGGTDQRPASAPPAAPPPTPAAHTTVTPLDALGDAVPPLAQTPPAAPKPPQSIPPSPFDMQATVHVKFAGDLKLDVMCDVGAPVLGGALWLPMQVHVRSVVVDAIAAVAYLHGGSIPPSRDSDQEEAVIDPRVCWALLEDEEGRGANIVQALHIETAVGDPGKQRLHNVAKVERFLIDAIHHLLDRECVWPNYHCIVIQR